MVLREHDNRVAIVGGGINGLVAANYLQRDGFQVTLLEKKDVTGGACAVDVVNFDGVDYQFACGASVLGFMQDFVFQETGLADRLSVHSPSHPEVVFFEGDETPCLMYEDADELAEEVRHKWGEKGDVKGFLRDLNLLVDFICDGYKRAQVPTIEFAIECLGQELTDLWISGTARDLLMKYFTSEKMRLFYAIDVVESGPVSLDSPYSAFSIALMATGTVFDGGWGFVRGRIWELSEALRDINRELGVHILTSVEAVKVSAKPASVTYRLQDSTQCALFADHIIFATDPINAARISGQPFLIESAAQKQILGTSGKLVMFFKKPVVWKGDIGYNDDFDMSFKFIVLARTLDELESSSLQAAAGEDYAPAFSEIYCEGAAMRHFGDSDSFDIVSVFLKHLAFSRPGSELPELQKKVEAQILAYVKNAEDLLGTVLLSPKDLQQRFDFPGGNIDHIEICDKQTYFARTWSANPEKNFYQFGNEENIMYCAAGTYPCGSIAGTPGYMCAKQLTLRLGLSEP